MSDQAHYDLYGQQFMLNADRAIFWQEKKTLILSDLHLGKAGHFRKSGIPIPRQIHVSDLQRINVLIERYAPKRILFLGDLFHSEENDEWNDFVFWSKRHALIEQVLVQGNHDILPIGLYADTPVQVVPKHHEGPFLFTHETADAEEYNISGHVHPGIRLYGKGRQGITLSCFYFGMRNALLPAFGQFTGNHPISVKKGDRVFAIADNEVVDFVG